MKISIDHVTNSSSESFGTVIIDSVTAIGLAVPFIAVTLGAGEGGEGDGEGDEGDDYTYAPYASTDPKDPPGTIIQKNKDGSETKTLPDGTKGTKMPDGTVYISAPDGTTGVIEPDGHQIINMPDGTRIEHFTSGASYAEYPDGTKRTEYPDGTIRQVKPNGEYIQVNPDETFETREPGANTSKVFDPDGKFIGARDERGTEVKIDDDGNISGIYVPVKGDPVEVSGNINTGFVMQNDKGTRVAIDGDGNIESAVIKSEEGYLTMDSKGAIKSEGRDPETGVTYEFEFDPEKGLKYKNSKGDFIDVDTEGKGEARVVTEEGEFTIEKSGRVEAKDKEGNYERYEPNEDGSATWERGNADGAQLKGEISKDGSVTYTASDGSQLVVKDDTLTVIDTAGNATTYTKEQLQQMAAEQAKVLEGGKPNVG